jgi:predicted Zn-dependent peptidase
MNRIKGPTAFLLTGFFLTAVPAGPGFGAQKRTLGNGLTVLLEKDLSSATTVLQILVKGGMRAEPAGRAGLAFLTTRLAVEIPDSSKAQELISLATRISVIGQGDSSGIHIECLSSNLEPSLKVISKIFLDPLFSGLRVDAVKKHMDHQGRIEEDDSVELGHLAALRAVFAGSGYGGSSNGDKASLDAIKSKDVSGYYKSTFVGANILLCFASDLPEETLLSLASRFFDRLPPGNPIVLPSISAAEPKERALRLERDTKQAFVSAAYRLPAASRRNFALATILQTALGKGQGSRLWPLRAEKKLAYNVNCRLTQMQEGGLIEAYLETDAARVDEARESLRAVMGALIEGGMTEEELLYAKTAARADFLRDTETKARRVSTLAMFESLGLGFDFMDAVAAEIDAPGLEEVHAYIKEILAPERALEVAIGPKPAG